MKICILTERMRLGFGVDLVVDEQARRLAERGYDVVVVVIHAETILPPRPYELIVLNRIMPIGDFGSKAWIEHVLSYCNVDADLWILSTPPFYDWARFLDGPVIFVEYGAPPGHMFEKHIGRHIDAMIEKRFRENYGNLLPCDAIVSISHSIHASLPKRAQEFSTVVHLGCDHYRRAGRDEAEALRAEIGVGPDDCLILWVGRMQIENDEQPYKGFKTLLSFLPLVQPHVRSAKFVLAGRVSDSDRARLESGGATVLPNLTPEGLGRAFAAADVLINLSRWEGFNLALLEAQYQGAPAVAFDLGPHPEIVRHGETGLLAKSSRDFFQSVVRIVNDRALRERLAEKTIEFAETFSWDASLDKLEKVIQDCAAKSPSRAEIAAMRRNAFEPDSAVRPAAPEAEIECVDDLLALNGRDFVRTAREIIFRFAPDETAEAMWIRRMRKGASKPAILFEMSEVAKTIGAYHEFPGLWSLLSRIRIERAFAGFARRNARAGRGSEWLDVQDEIFVRRAYRVLLGREAAAFDIGPKVDQLRNGRSRRSMLAEIRFSDEGWGRPLEDPELILMLESEGPARPLSAPNQPQVYEVAVEWSPRQEFFDKLASFGASPKSSVWYRYADDEFVRRSYATLLGRSAAPSEVDDKAAQLRLGRSRRSMLAEIRFSEEGRGRRLEDRDLRRILLPDILKRRPPLPPRPPILSRREIAREFGANLLRLGQKQPVSQWFLLDDDAFVRQAFRGLLGREIDPATAAGLVEQLGDGRRRTSILAEIRFSEEGRARKLLDPELRRLLFAESLRRAPPIRWILSPRKPGDSEPEDIERQIRRVESRQRALAAHFDHFDAALSGATHQNAALGRIVAKLDAMEARISVWQAEQSARDRSAAPRSDQAPSAYRPYVPSSSAMRLGPSHVALVAPEMALDPFALARLAEAAQAAGGDIIFGDESELLDRPPFERLRILGPFSHDAFLRNPDLGGVIAVREELMTRLHLPATTALTGKVLLRLIAAAHKVTHLPTTLGRRTTAAIAANLATFAHMQLYVDGLGRKAAVERRDDNRFDIRFPLATEWKAAIIVLADHEDGLESTLAALQDLTPPEQRHLIIVRRAREETGRIDASDRRRTDLWRPADARYGEIVNEAVSAAPDDCDLVVLMQGGVLPTTPDWLERLAESALRSDTGAVAPKTLYLNKSIRHAGMRFDGDGLCSYVSRFAQTEGSGDYGQTVDLDRLKGLRDVSAVSSHCMIFRRSVFRDQGQFSREMDGELCDLDFCFRLRRAGLAVLVDGRVAMFHADDREPRWARTFAEAELATFKAKHAALLSHEDRFWAPFQRAGEASRAHATYLPPQEAR